MQCSRLMQWAQCAHSRAVRTTLTVLVDPGRAPAGLVDVVLSYCHKCLNDRTLLPLLPYFKSKGVGVISASFSSMGMFTKQARPRW
jgi:hypothetical protein